MMYRKDGGKKGFIIILLFTTLVTALCYFLYNINTQSIKGRLLIYRVCLESMNSKFITGIGFQQFKVNYNNYQSKFLRDSNLPLDVMSLADNTYFCFNEFIQVFIELGAIGLGIVISIIILIFKPIFKTPPFSPSKYALGALASCVSIALCSMSSYPLQDPGLVILLLLNISIISNENNLYKIHNVEIKHIPIRLGMLIQIAIFSIMLYIEYNRFTSLRKWERAAHLSIIGDFNKGYVLYKEASIELNNHGPFMYNYGSETFISGRKEQSISILERAKHIYSHSNLYIYLGDNYRELGDFKKSESCYIHSIYIQPSKFLPKFKLLLLYEKFGLQHKALTIAKEIMSFPIKVPSDEVNQYRNYAANFLNDANEHSD